MRIFVCLFEEWINGVVLLISGQTWCFLFGITLRHRSLETESEWSDSHWKSHNIKKPHGNWANSKLLNQSLQIRPGKSNYSFTILTFTNHSKPTKVTTMKNSSFWLRSKLLITKAICERKKNLHHLPSFDSEHEREKWKIQFGVFFLPFFAQINIELNFLRFTWLFVTLHFFGGIWRWKWFSWFFLIIAVLKENDVFQISKKPMWDGSLLLLILENEFRWGTSHIKKSPTTLERLVGREWVLNDLLAPIIIFLGTFSA
jgi:hypothetical protein